MVLSAHQRQLLKLPVKQSNLDCSVRAVSQVRRAWTHERYWETLITENSRLIAEERPKDCSTTEGCLSVPTGNTRKAIQWEIKRSGLTRKRVFEISATKSQSNMEAQNKDLNSSQRSTEDTHPLATELSQAGSLQARRIARRFPSGSKFWRQRSRGWRKGRGVTMLERHFHAIEILWRSKVAFPCSTEHQVDGQLR